MSISEEKAKGAKSSESGRNPARLVARLRAREAQIADLQAEVAHLKDTRHREPSNAYMQACLMGDRAELQRQLEQREAQIAKIVQEMRDEDWHQHTTSPLSVEAVVNGWADRLTGSLEGRGQGRETKEQD